MATLDEKILYSTNFNSALKKIVNLACKKSKVLRVSPLQRKVSLSIDATPFEVMESAGPYILKYADKIKKRDESFYLKTDFSPEIKNGAADDADLQKSVATAIDQVRSMYKTLDQPDKDKMNDWAEDMLSSYCDYLVIQRGLANLEMKS